MADLPSVEEKRNDVTTFKEQHQKQKKEIVDWKSNLDLYEQALKTLWSNDWYSLLRLGKWGETGKGISNLSPIPEPFDCYHPFACHYCKRGPFIQMNLKRCSKCRIAMYCCADHQKRDWLRGHRQFCQAYRSIQQQQQQSSLVSSNEDCANGQNIFAELARPTSIASWKAQTKIATIALLEAMQQQTKQQTSIPITALQMLLLQPRCMSCLKAGTCDGIRLLSCPRCSGVALCEPCRNKRKQHQMGGVDSEQKCNDYSEKYNEEEDLDALADLYHSRFSCDQFRIFIASLGLIVEQKSPLCVQSETDCSEYFAPKNWLEYFHKKRNDFASSVHPVIMSMAPVITFLTDGLCLPLTIHHALSQPEIIKRREVALSHTHNDPTKSLVVHIIGASYCEEMGVHKYIELIRLNPRLQYLRIVLVGSELEHYPDFPTDGQPLNFTDPLSSPIRDSCDAKIVRRIGAYPDFVNNLIHDMGTPDIILVPHGQAYHNIYKSRWEGVVNCLKSSPLLTSVPVLWTERTMEEAQKTAATLLEWNAHVMIQATPNLFKGLRPYVQIFPDGTAAWDFETEDDGTISSSPTLVYSHAYYVVTKGLG